MEATEIILNRAFGGISDEAAAHRQDPEWIRRVKAGYHGEDKGWIHENLQVYTIPSGTVDWKILNYDGKEGLVYSNAWGELCFVGCDDIRR